MCQPRIFCQVKQGINTCDICCKDAYYSLKIPQQVPEKYKGMSIMCLLRCGHGICNECYQNIKSRSKFCCPFCRNESVGIMKSFGSNEIKGTMNTLGEFIREWQHHLPRAFGSQHIFAKLHRQIANDYKKERDLQKQKNIKERKRQEFLENKRIKAESRAKAICKHCGKDTFTGEKQLLIHIRAKH